MRHGVNSYCCVNQMSTSVITRLKMVSHKYMSIQIFISRIFDNVPTEK